MTKIQIRQNVFETNSSSTHCISVVCEGADTVGTDISYLEFELGEFGWEWEKYNTIHSKASYLWTAIVHSPERNYEIDAERIRRWLEEEGIEVSFDYTKCTWNDKYFEGYVDHTEDLPPFIEYVLESKEHLISFLFDSNSCICTGNDNDDEDICFVTMPEGKQAVEFYKGN